MEQYLKQGMMMAALALLLSFGSAAQAVTLGPGDIVNDFNDGSGDLIIIDTTATALLTAGTYKASWSYQFNQTGGHIGGTVQPFLATSPGSGVFNVIALGSAVAYTVDTPFLTGQAFGGTDMFTLASDTTVFAGFYGDLTAPDRTPIGYFQDGGNTNFQRTFGAAPPQ